MASRPGPLGFQSDTNKSSDGCHDCETPHLVIRNRALSHFWKDFITPHDSIRKIGFISKLTNSLVAPLGFQHRDVKDGTTILPLKPFGYGLAESEILLLLRGAPRGYVEEIVRAIDVDEAGIITSIKLDVVTSSIPIDTSLRDTLLFLAYQGGRKVVIPKHFFDLTEIKIISRLRSLESPERMASRLIIDGSKGPATAQDQTTLLESVPALSLFLVGADEFIQDDTQKQIVEIMGRASGWNVILGQAGVGKTIRVISAARTFLAQNVQNFHSNRSRPSRRSYSRNFVPYDISKDDKSSPQISAPSSLFYINLAGCRSKSELLACLATQLGVSEGGGVGCGEETEQRVLRVLGEIEVK